MFCVASSTTRAAWCRDWTPGLGHRAAGLHPGRRCRPNLPGMGFFFFSFSQLDQFPEGMIWRSSSNPTCPAIRMYPCRQKRDMIIRRGNKFRESSTPLPGAGLGFLLLVGVGRGGPAVRETQGSYHPVEVDRVTLLAQGWAPTPRPGAPPQEGSGDACPGEGHVRSPRSRGGVGRAGQGLARGSGRGGLGSLGGLGKACAGAQSVGVAGTWRDGTAGGWVGRGPHRARATEESRGLGEAGSIPPRAVGWGLSSWCGAWPRDASAGGR